ncbi:MAG: hypothetical protein AAB343_02675 [Patescibacteria group bacterium]
MDADGGETDPAETGTSQRPYLGSFYQTKIKRRQCCLRVFALILKEVSRA